MVHIVSTGKRKSLLHNKSKKISTILVISCNSSFQSCIILTTLHVEQTYTNIIILSESRFLPQCSTKIP
jgi:hypothetical protein